MKQPVEVGGFALVFVKDFYSWKENLYNFFGGQMFTCVNPGWNSQLFCVGAITPPSG